MGVVVLSMITPELCAQPLAPRNRVIRKSLLEVYSAYKCAFCIESDNTLMNAIEGCPIQVISYHSGPLAGPPPSGAKDLRTDCGQQINDSFDIQSYPSGIWNRSSTPQNYTQWSSANKNNQYASVSLGVESIYNPDFNECNLRIEIFPFEDFHDSLIYLNVMLIENNVEGPQINHSGEYIQNYKHPFVFRDHVSPCWGDKIDNLSIRNAKNKYYTYQLPKDVNPNNAMIVVFVTNAKGEVLNSEGVVVKGGKTEVTGVMTGNTYHLLEMETEQTIYDTFQYVSYQRREAEHEFSVHVMDTTVFDVEFWVDTFPAKRKCTIKCKPNDTIIIVTKVKSKKKRAYCHFNFKISIPGMLDPCQPQFEKEFHIILGSNSIVYNTARLRNGDSNTIDLALPIVETFRKHLCEDYCSIADTSFLFVIKVCRILKKLPWESIYYAAGWGQPIFPGGMVEVLDSALKQGINLYLAAQDLGYSLGRNHSALPKGGLAWFRDSLGVHYQIDGDNSMGTMMYDYLEPRFGDLEKFNLYQAYGSGSNYQITPDEIWVDPISATQFVFNRRDRCTGFYKQLDRAKLVMLTFGAELIEDDDARHALLTRIGRFFGTCDNWATGTDDLFPKKRKPKDPNYQSFQILWSDDFMRISTEDVHEDALLSVYQLDGKKILQTTLSYGVSEWSFITPPVAVGTYYYSILGKDRSILQSGVLPYLKAR